MLGRFLEAVVAAICLTLTVVGVVGIGVFINSVFGWVGVAIWVMLVGFTLTALMVSNILDWWHGVQRRM